MLVLLLLLLKQNDNEIYSQKHLAFFFFFKLFLNKLYEFIIKRKLQQSISTSNSQPLPPGLLYFFI